MTKQEFIMLLPETIQHPTWGLGTLEIVSDTVLKKFALYRHNDDSTSYWSFGNSWEETYEMMHVYFKKAQEDISVKSHLDVKLATIEPTRIDFPS